MNFSSLFDTRRTVQRFACANSTPKIAPNPLLCHTGDQSQSDDLCDENDLQGLVLISRTPLPPKVTLNAVVVQFEEDDMSGPKSGWPVCKKKKIAYQNELESCEQRYPIKAT